MRLLPRVYICRDVIMVRWRDYEWLIKRWNKSNFGF